MDVWDEKIVRDTSRVSTLVYSTIPVILLYTQNPVDSFEAVHIYIWKYIYEISHICNLSWSRPYHSELPRGTGQTSSSWDNLETNLSENMSQVLSNLHTATQHFVSYSSKWSYSDKQLNLCLHPDSYAVLLSRPPRSLSSVAI